MIRCSDGFALKSAFLITILTVVALPFPEALRYETASIAAGEIWRIATGVFTHLSVAHACVNLAALWLIVLIFRRILPGGLSAFLLGACMVATGPVLLIVLPTVEWYAGLSAPLHGYAFACALYGTISGDAMSRVAMLVIVAKLQWEAWFGAMPGAEALIGGPVAWETHLAGAAIGLAFASVAIAVRGTGRGYNAGPNGGA